MDGVDPTSSAGFFPTLIGEICSMELTATKVYLAIGAILFFAHSLALGVIVTSILIIGHKCFGSLCSGDDSSQIGRDILRGVGDIANQSRNAPQYPQYQPPPQDNRSRQLPQDHHQHPQHSRGSDPAHRSRVVPDHSRSVPAPQWMGGVQGYVDPSRVVPDPHAGQRQTHEHVPAGHRHDPRPAHPPKKELHAGEGERAPRGQFLSGNRHDQQSAQQSNGPHAGQVDHIETSQDRYSRFIAAQMDPTLAQPPAEHHRQQPAQQPKGPSAGQSVDVLQAVPGGGAAHRQEQQAPESPHAGFDHSNLGPDADRSQCPAAGSGGGQPSDVAHRMLDKKKRGPRAGF